MRDTLSAYLKLDLPEREMFRQFLLGTTICQHGFVPMYLYDLDRKQAELQKQLVGAY